MQLTSRSAVLLSVFLFACGGTPPDVDAGNTQPVGGGGARAQGGGGSTGGSGGGSTSTGGGGGSTSTGSYTVSAAPTMISLAQGSNRAALVTLQRTNFTDDIVVQLAANTPVGITAAPVTLSGSSGQVVLTVAATQPLGGVDVFLEASSGTHLEQALLHVEVTDGVAPFIVSSSPLAGATGVRDDAVVVVQFSEAMNTARVETAWSWNAGMALFSWNAAHTQLTVTPGAALAWGTAAAAQTYSFHLEPGATDVGGNALMTAASVTFSTLRVRQVLIPTVASSDGYLIDFRIDNGGATAFTTNPNLLVGDNAGNRQITSWMTFDLSLVPVTRSSDVLSAELEMPLFNTIGTLDVSLCGSVQTCLSTTLANFGALLNVNAYGSTSGNLGIPMALDLTGSAPLYHRNVRLELVAAWDDRVMRSNRLQFEAQLGNSSNLNSDADYLEFWSGDGSATDSPRVRVTALLP